jgi:hypothetical protein
MNKGIKKSVISLIVIAVTLMTLTATAHAFQAGGSAPARHVTWAISQLLFPFGTEETWRMILGSLATLFSVMGLLLIHKRTHEIGRMGGLALTGMGLSAAFMGAFLVLFALSNMPILGSIIYRFVSTSILALMVIFSVLLAFLFSGGKIASIGKFLISDPLKGKYSPIHVIASAVVLVGVVNMWSDLVVYHLPTLVLASWGIALTILYRDTLMERLGFANKEEEDESTAPESDQEENDLLPEDQGAENSPPWKCEEETEEGEVCGTQNKAEAEYCKQCGKRRKTLPWTCSECSEESNSWDGHFCEKCGTQRPTEEEPAVA